MNLLLDTHVALWAIAGSRRLGAKARALIESPSNTVAVSAVSLWEIAIKQSLGRGDMPISSEEAMRHFRAAGYRMMPIEAEHAIAVESLPPIHADPFDRMLVAQALTEPLRLLTRDKMLAHYGEMVLCV